MFDHQMVVKFLDGTMLKGFGPFIAPGDLMMDFQDLQNNIHFVDLGKVKAVFYVHSLEGLRQGHPKKRRETQTFASGEKVRVKFKDGEEVIGVMTNPDISKAASGFYVTPTEEGSNNYRIYANRNAVEAMWVKRMGLEINLLT
ncbi:MAG TPA: hypothetical protein PK014_00185 [Thermoanaerobaculia bacterium]|nr:hypothetical protein [Thermoanaerobaculia bacterium]HXK69131.1 hypothetical protein [Thermoanaerobaculia bacterium]